MKCFLSKLLVCTFFDRILVDLVFTACVTVLADPAAEATET